VFVLPLFPLILKPFETISIYVAESAASAEVVLASNTLFSTLNPSLLLSYKNHSEVESVFLKRIKAGLNPV